MDDENQTTPPDAVPPKPADAPKVQPKKETVRISLPPKPTSTSTIKLPSLPTGAKPPGPGTAVPPPAKAPAVGAAPAAPKPPGAAAPVSAKAAAAPAAPGPVPAAPGARPGPAAAPPAPAGKRPKAALPSGRATVGPMDKALAIAAAVLGLGAVASLLMLLNMK